MRSAIPEALLKIKNVTHKSAAAVLPGETRGKKRKSGRQPTKKRNEKQIYTETRDQIFPSMATNTNLGILLKRGDGG
jgi:hypothetical protein